MGKPVRWFKKFFKSSKSPLKRKSNEKENEQDQVIASKSPNEKQINANVPTRDQVTQEFTQAVEADPHQDQNVMQLIAEPRKIHVAATMESVTSHPLPPPPDMCSTVVKSSSHGNEDVETKAAIRIQTAFRGFLASRAFSALKGLVRLQALVRGHRVRRQAAVALRCVLAIVKLQAHARAYLLRMTEGGPEAQKVIHGSPQTANEVEQPKRICQTNTNITLASAFQRQLNSSLSRHFLSSFQVGKHDSGWCWLERWTTARPWVLESVSEQNIVFSQEFKRCKENGDVSDAISKDDRAYCGKSRISLTEKMPLPNPPISSLMTPNGPSHYPSDSYLPPERSPSGSPLDGEGGLLTPCQGSPHLDFRSSDGSFCVYDPSPNETISRKSAPLEKERDSVSSKNTPRFSNSSKSCSAIHESPILAKVENIQIQVEGSPTMVPSYMATTESSKAKVRSNSTPRNRPDLTEKSPKTFKRRLSLPGSNGKASPEATHSQRWNLYGRPGSIGFGSSVRVEKHASLLSGSRREIQKNLK